MKSANSRYLKNILIATNIISILVIVWILSYVKNDTLQGQTSHELNGNYKFTNPILDYEIDESYINKIAPRSEIENLAESLKKRYAIKIVSLYYRDLNNGPWVGINEKEYFSPASMLKTPLMISFFRYAEAHPEILSKRVTVTSKDFVGVSSQYIKEPDVVKVDTTYTMIELVESMITKSDNVAARLVHQNISQKYVDEIYQEIGVPIVTSKDNTLIRIKDMGSFFRILYNASYLNREHSEQALDILSRSSYKYGLVAGVPKDVVVAHKFGERTPEGILYANGILVSNDVQLHECGIIYHSRNPFVLCVMTRGNSYKNQEKVLSEISRFFYKKVDQSYGT